MNKGVYARLATLVGIFACLLLLSSPPSLSAQDNVSKGNVIGFLYAKDGTTPLEGAVLKFKNMTSGSMFISSKTDGYGIFKLEGIESGLYTYGVETEKGDFNADSFVGLKLGENETAKLSIALDPYDKEAGEAISEIYREQEKNGEVLIGTIADFNPNTGLAYIQVIKGMLQMNDKIHTRGTSTNFYQEVDVLMVGDNKAKRVLKGQTGTVKLQRDAKPGDLVYLVPATRVFPIFLAPLGVAAVIGGNEVVTYGIMKIKDQAIPASADRD